MSIVALEAIMLVIFQSFYSFPFLPSSFTFEIERSAAVDV
jgi:hypothetical protein